ncbi:hypothetical protein OG455_41970 [Kitasatospora sp. NBC_01287]|uniref:hypothetical protein n=1 Tax=Kitasatospora sp. NBC_01287 TaxID=2903573 RepID=UPI002254B844|nr:hypothetical protein [Kitasatospora sp. NBC_01287]MCX4752013.1 hypothetical protein [Kitasatospora sp. NBC_01287]
MPNATVQDRLAEIGRIEPSGTTGFNLVHPITLAQLRQLVSAEWVSAVTTTQRGGITRFRFVAAVSGQQFTVTGRLSEGQQPGSLKLSPRWDEPALFDNSAATGRNQGGNNR